MVFHYKQRRYKKLLAFSLTEVAVVILIASLTIGAVFAVMGKVNGQNRINNASEQLVLIIQKARSFYSGQNVSRGILGNRPEAAGLANNGKGFNVGGAFNQLFINERIIPQELIIPGAPPQTRDAFNGITNVGLANCGSFGGMIQFVVEFTNLSAQDCAAMVAKNSSPGSQTGLIAINITPQQNGNGNNIPLFDLGKNPQALPVPFDLAAQNCVGDAGNRYIVDWYVQLGNGCGPWQPC